MLRWLVNLLIVACMSGCAQQPHHPDTIPITASKSAIDILDAERALREAREAGFLWSDSEELLANARDAAAKGDEARAIELANQARAQGELAINQYYLARAKDLLDTLKRGGLSTAQASSIAKAQDRVRNIDGKAAFEQLAAVASQRGITVAPFPGPSLPSRIATIPVPVAAHPAPGYPVHHGRPH